MLLVLVCGIFIPMFAFSQEHQHGEHHAEELGEVHFPVSCGEEAQKEFNRAVALLHDFWYAEAEKAFGSLGEKNPGCAMAFWGAAVSNYHPIWAPPNSAEMQRGKTAVEKAASMAVSTDREQGYVSAIATFYKDSEKLDHPTRARAYAAAMEQVHKENPEDLEAAVFHALALLGTAQAADKTYAVQKQAAAILSPLVQKAPNHPGISHYIIHSFDYPSLAELALPAARTYAKVAPSSPHALHMPSHIFTRLGLWQESIDSNIASAAKAKAHVEKTMPGAGSFDQLHAMDYLVYAYLQLGNEKAAGQILEEAEKIGKLDLDNFAAAYAFAAMPARYALERNQWKDAAALRVAPVWFPWQKFSYAEAITHFAAGVGAARSADVETAVSAERRLGEIHKTLVDQDKYWAGQVEIQRLSVAAWLAYAQGKREEALQMMRSATELEDSTEKHPVTPGAILPAHELLGDMLMELGRPKEAEAEYKKSLATAPNRLRAIKMKF